MAKSTLKEFIDGGNREFLDSMQDKVPPGWLSRQQIEAKTGMKKYFVNRRMKRLTALGKVKVQVFRVKCGNNVRPMPHYYLPDYC